MDTSEEIKLLIDFRKGDVNAYEKVFRLFYKQLRLEAFLLLDNEKDAEDIVQQMFLDIWHKRLFANIDQSLRAYLYAATKNRCLNFLDKRRKYREKISVYMDDMPAAEIADIYENTRVLPPRMKSALATMPAQRLAAFNLVYIEDKSYKDAAMEMGISINSIKTHLKIGLKSLRAALSTH